MRPWLEEVRAGVAGAAAPLVAGLAAAAALTPVAGSATGAGPMVLCVVVATLVPAALVAAADVAPALRRFRGAAAPLALAAGVAVAVAVSGAGTQSVQGISRLVTSTVPLAASPPEVAALGAAAAVASTLAAVAAARGRPLAVVLAAPVVLAVAGLALVAADRPGPLSLLPLLVSAALLAVLERAGKGAGRAVAASLALALAVGAGGVGAAAVSGAVGDPVDPRAGVSVPVVPTQAVSPLASFAAARAGPDVPLVEITGPVPPRLRLVTLGQFDGTAWTSAGSYRRAGTRMPPAPAEARPPAVEQVTLDLVLPNPDLLGWVPAPGRVVALSIAGLGVDVDTGDVVVPQGVQLPGRLQVTAELPVVAADELLGAVAAPPERPAPSVVADVAPALTELVEAARRPVGGDEESDFAVLAALEASLRDPTRFVVDTGEAPPVGHGLLQVQKALADGSGTAEQYASAFAVGARLLGAQSRVVVGYAVPEGPGGASRVGTRDLDVWPEVRFDALGWVAFEPVPGAGRAVPPPEQGGGGAPSPSPSSSPPGEDAPEQRPADAAADDGAGAGTAGTAVAVGVGGALMLLLVPWSVKRARRARRRRAPPEIAVAGAWRELGDRLTERGQRPAPGTTAADVAGTLSERLDPDVTGRAGAGRAGAGRAGADRAGAHRVGARRAARDLAAVAGAVRFGPEPATTADAERAWGALAAVERGLAAGEPWPRRLRAALDARPTLRR